MKVVRKHFETLDSTNTWAKSQAPLLPRDQMTLITAGMQTAGRGRFKREWVSPPDLNIYATFCFFLEKHREDLGNLPQILALSAAKTLEFLKFKPVLKWPNDVLLSGKKVAGILCETTPLSDQLCVALGIGLNVNMPLESLQKIDRPATSLLVESGRPGNVEEVLQLLQDTFMKDFELYLEEGFYPFLEEYRQRMAHKVGDSLKFHDNRVVWEGTFVEITTDGALHMQLPSGEVKRFIAGEILF